MNAANPDSASEAISDESDDLIAELARIVARDAHAGRQDLQPEPRQPPPMPSAPARPAAPGPDPDAPAKDPEEILSEGFRALAEPPLATPDHAATPEVEPSPAGLSLPPLRPADLGLAGAEPAPRAEDTKPEAGLQEQGAISEPASPPPAAPEQPAPPVTPTAAEPKTAAAPASAEPAAPYDPIADPIADLIAAAEAEEPEAPPQAPPAMAAPAAEPEPEQPAPEPEPPAAEPADRFETPPAMRATPTARETPRAAAVDPLDEIERLIAETTAFDLPGMADAEPPAWEATGKGAAAPAPEAKSTPAARTLDAAAETADAAIEASVAVSRTPDEADRRPGARAFASTFGGGLGRSIIPATAGIVVVALIGGAAWWYFTQDGALFGEVPVVTAPDQAVKQPAPETATPDDSDSIVFSQLEGAETTSPENEQLVSRDETGGESGEGLARVITPESDTGGLANRKVRTVTVRADGTIVSGDEATAGIEPLPALRPNVPDVPGAPAIEDGDADTIGDVLNQLAEEEPGLLGETPVATASVGEPAASPATASPTPSPAAEQPINVANVDPAPIPIPRPEETPGGAATAPTATASTGVVSTPPPPAADQPLALEQATATPVVTASGAPFYVQLSSQRSEAAARASATDLTERLATVLGATKLEIQRVDLGDRGVFYRVKAPAASLTAAKDLCGQVKVAGADCFVRSD